MAKGTKNATRRAILQSRRVKRAQSVATKSQAQDQQIESAESNTSPVSAPLNPDVARKQKALHRQTRQVKDVRRLKSSMKHWTGVLNDYKRCKVKVAEAMAQLVEARKQISDLNMAVNFLLQQPPNNGHLFDEHNLFILLTIIYHHKNLGMWMQWTKKA
ncbi:hypothetical protein NEMBOFW57_006845 [Staphylotrichum longicolle]|uniref:Uncharacterized protein n=1 Tax=Staphylotrichum longicolle TaxID=669026 RepID=A0AAD4ETE3_9PEZI|nr:hypothetical protein NEMBOFW57_006845 [Staphylotrichum longicolle]